MNKEQAIRSIKGCFYSPCCFDMQATVEALVMNDLVALASIREKVIKNNAQQDFYIKQVEACTTDAQVDRVVASVKRDII